MIVYIYVFFNVSFIYKVENAVRQGKAGTSYTDMK